jgi:hypothetical protein
MFCLVIWSYATSWTYVSCTLHTFTLGVLAMILFIATASTVKKQHRRSALETKILCALERAAHLVKTFPRR